MRVVIPSVSWAATPQGGGATVTVDTPSAPGMAFCRDQGGGLQRRPAGGDQPGFRDYRLHQRLQPHQRHRDRFPRSRV